MENIIVMSSQLMKILLLNIRLPKNRFDVIYTDYIDNDNLTVSLLNTRSLQKHAAVINRVRWLTKKDILCLAEIQITNDTDVA